MISSEAFKYWLISITVRYFFCFFFWGHKKDKHAPKVGALDATLIICLSKI